MVTTGATFDCDAEGAGVDLGVGFGAGAAGVLTAAWAVVVRATVRVATGAALAVAGRAPCLTVLVVVALFEVSVEVLVSGTGALWSGVVGWVVAGAVSVGTGCAS